MRRQIKQQAARAGHVRPLICCASLAVLTLSVVSCGTTKLESWMNPAYQERPPGKIVVVGVAQSDDVRRQYEDLFVERLAAAGVEGVTSYATVSQPERLSEEEIDQAVSELEADSVIVTRVISEIDRSQYTAGMSMPAAYYDYYDYYDSSYDYVHTPGYVQNYIEYRLETNLYDVETGDLVWSGRKMITDQQSAERSIKSVISATIGDLQKKGLL